MEKRDLYDINKRRTPYTIFKGEEVPEDRYTISVLALIQNSQNEILVQKRSIQKDGKYGLTSGHPKSGENSVQGMVTEIKEELGLDVSESELQLVYSERNDEKRKFYDLYYLKKDYNIDKMNLQQEEVESVKWCSKEEINKLCLNGEFKESHIEAFEALMKRIN